MFDVRSFHLVAFIFLRDLKLSVCLMVRCYNKQEEIKSKGIIIFITFLKGKKRSHKRILWGFTVLRIPRQQNCSLSHLMCASLELVGIYWFGTSSKKKLKSWQCQCTLCHLIKFPKFICSRTRILYIKYFNCRHYDDYLICMMKPLMRNCQFFKYFIHKVHSIQLQYGAKR